jgi:ribulose-phosphate 3-epimerase
LRDNIRIAASLLSADMANFTRSIERVAREVDYIHCDVMDAHFVPNLTFGPPVVKAIKKASLGIPLDVHLMIERPIYWIPRFLEAGLDARDFLTFHIEAEEHCQPGLEIIRKAGVGAGLSIKPKTSFDALRPFEGLLDQVLVMTVEPGFGGQSFMADMLEKIRAARQVFKNDVLIGVDGGIDVKTAPLAASAGANLLVAGNAIFGWSRPAYAAKRIRKAAQAGVKSILSWES